jgi:two-component system, chemotaxis family, protein-glutamate methylesterase/glutaminase
MKVLVVDDSAFMRRAISQMLANDPLIQVVGTARNGREAVELAKKLAPDVITMDIEMPEMDGLTALRQIMRDCPTQVLMLSSLTAEGSIVSLQALRIGAADVLAKDVSQVSLSITNIQQDLLTRVRALGQARNRHAKKVGPVATPVESTLRFRPGQFDLVCIGSSTGGPPVLETILAAVPKTMTTPIVIAQHMPELFTRSMAQRLAELTGRPVHHGASGMPVERRGIYISPGGKHTHIRKIGLARWELLVSDQPREAIYRPSVDVLLSTGSQVTNGRALGIVLTGIGDDGLLGARELHQHGGTIIAQDEESCVVYGMPKSVTQAGLPAASLNPTQIGALVATLAEPFTAAKAG